MYNAFFWSLTEDTFKISAIAALFVIAKTWE